MNKIRLNLGCGTRLIDGFVNIDGAKSLWLVKLPLLKSILAFLGFRKAKLDHGLTKDITYMHLPYGLKRFKENSSDRIYSSHFLEHLKKEDAEILLSEIFRILDSKGVTRIVVPDAPIYCKKYLEDTNNAIRDKRFTTEYRDTLFDSLVGGWHKNILNSHLFFWDTPSLCAELKRKGFVDITICEFGKGVDPLMNAADNYEGWSLCIEATKP
jgi:hypothetical protein